MDVYMAKVVYSGEGAAMSFGGNMSFSNFSNMIRNRFPQLEKLGLKVKYSVHPDPTVYQLENEVDMSMLFRVLGRFKSDFVDVEVKSCSDGQSVLTNSESEVSSCLSEENVFLGCYRQDDSKLYLSSGWKSLINSKGQYFEGGVREFRTKLRMYAIEVGFEYDFDTNKPDRVIAVCKKKSSEGCSWIVKASLSKHNGFFYIYELSNDHQCHFVVRLQKSSMLSSHIVKEVMLDKARENPNLKAIDVQKDLKLNYGLDISYHNAWYGKERAREAVLGVESDSYHNLIWFSEQTLKANPGSRIVVEYAVETNKFERMFVCYDAWMKGFQSCRPVLFIDGTFLTNKYKGILLSASAKDGNSGLYPVAYAIVDSETESNWSFFLKCISECLSRFEERQITFISDRNIGLLKAVRSVFPGSPLGFCHRHLQANLSKKYPYNSNVGKSVEVLFMRCAYSRTREYFEINYRELMKIGGDIVNQFLKDLPVETWASCFFNGDRFGEITNNLSECFNSWVKDLKCLPIVELNEAIRIKCMALIASRKEESAGWVSELCPNYEKILAKKLGLGRHWLISRSDTFLYEVQCQKYSVVVNLEEYSCSCGEWKVQGFPCSHALVTIQKHGSNVYSYVNPFFKVSKYRDTYSFGIKPVATISRAIDKAESSLVVEPPSTKRPAGRPRVQRFKSRHEVKRVVMCSRCKKYSGHNRKTCKEVI